jgi:hypothetical protein
MSETKVAANPAWRTTIVALRLGLLSLLAVPAWQAARRYGLIIGRATPGGNSPIAGVLRLTHTTRFMNPLTDP